MPDANFIASSEKSVMILQRSVAQKRNEISEKLVEKTKEYLKTFDLDQTEQINEIAIDHAPVKKTTPVSKFDEMYAQNDSQSVRSWLMIFHFEVHEMLESVVRFKYFH